MDNRFNKKDDNDDNNENQGTITGSVGREGLKAKIATLLNNMSKKQKALALFLLVAVVFIGIGISLWYRYTPYASVGGQTITRNEYRDFKARIGDFFKFNSDKDSLKNLSNNARDYLLESKIVNVEAKKRGLTVSEAEIKKEYDEIINEYGSEAEFARVVHDAYNWTPELTKEAIKTDILKEKLQRIVLKGSDVTMLYVRYDMGVDETVEDPLAKPLIDQFYNRLQTGDSIEQIASTTECQPPKCYSKQYSQLNDSSSKQTFFTTKGEEWSAISKVTKAGDYTNVVRTNGGFYAIFRIDAITNGQFNTWSDFIADYKKNYVTINASTKLAMKRGEVFAMVKNGAYMVFSAIDHLINQRTSAACPDKAYHPAKVYIRIIDRATGFGINGATAKETVSDYHGVCKTLYYDKDISKRTLSRVLNFAHPHDVREVTSKEIQKIGNDDLPDGQKTGWAVFADTSFSSHNAPDCHYHWHFTVSMEGYSTFLGTGWGIANGTTEIWKVKMNVVKWTLKGTSQVEVGAKKGTNLDAYVGDKVTFSHDIYNSSKDNMPSSQTFKSEVRWSPGNAPSAADGPRVKWTSNPISGTDMPNTATHTSKKSGVHIVPRENEKTFDTSGTYCQDVAWWPASSTDNDNYNNRKVSDRACVNVRPKAGNYIPVVEVPKFEKGSPSITITHRVEIDKTSLCTDARVGNTYTKRWAYSGWGGVTGEKTLSVKCAAVGKISNLANDTQEIVISASSYINQLNVANPGSTDFARKTVVYRDTGEVLAEDEKKIQVYEVPYVRFYGHDIYAHGGGVTFNYRFNGVNNYSGSVSQYATIAAATSNLVKIITANFRSDAPLPAGGLKAADFKTEKNLDILDKLPEKGNLCSESATTFNFVGVNKNGYCRVAGKNLTINGGSTSNKVTIFSEADEDSGSGGNVYIKNNITANMPAGEVFVDKSTPTTLIVASGDIFIDKSVTRIDAVLLAGVGAGGGTIYTCANGFNPISSNNWLSECRKKLVINGAIGASNIAFMRSIGSRLLGEAEEDKAYITDGNITDVTGNNNRAAEVINYPAYLNFSTFYLIDYAKSGYQALLNAPPHF